MPVGHLILRHMKIRGPLRHSPVEHARQCVDLRIARQVGVDREVLAYQFPQTRRLGPCVVDRLSVLMTWRIRRLAFCRLGKHLGTQDASA